MPKNNFFVLVVVFLLSTWALADGYNPLGNLGNTNGASANSDADFDKLFSQYSNAVRSRTDNTARILVPGYQQNNSDNSYGATQNKAPPNPPPAPPPAATSNPNSAAPYTGFTASPSNNGQSSSPASGGFTNIYN